MFRLSGYRGGNTRGQLDVATENPALPAVTAEANRWRSRTADGRGSGGRRLREPHCAPPARRWRRPRRTERSGRWQQPPQLGDGTVPTALTSPSCAPASRGFLPGTPARAPPGRRFWRAAGHVTQTPTPGATPGPAGGGAEASPAGGACAAKAESRTSAARRSGKPAARASRLPRRARPGAEASIHTPPPATCRPSGPLVVTQRAPAPRRKWAGGGPAWRPEGRSPVSAGGGGAGPTWPPGRGPWGSPENGGVRLPCCTRLGRRGHASAQGILGARAARRRFWNLESSRGSSSPRLRLSVRPEEALPLAGGELSLSPGAGPERRTVCMERVGRPTAFGGSPRSPSGSHEVLTDAWDSRGAHTALASPGRASAPGGS